jgi:hypothetical protein
MIKSIATCPKGTTLTGGGARTIPLGSREGAEGVIEASWPGPSPNQWRAELVVTSDKKGTIGVQAWALCAK